ncbi:Leucine aminopeptidase 1 [Entomortierella beljakovae]|nr:Leucine aminopeptidase 1 [Entomortierella beljakovae]
MVKLNILILLTIATSATALVIPSWWEQFSLGRIRSSVHHQAPTKVVDEIRLIQTSKNKAPFWTTEKQRLELIRENVNFMDITDHQDLGDMTIHSNHSRYLINANKALPKRLHQQQEFKKYEKELSIAYMEDVLSEFVKFHNRYYKSEYGLEAAQWLHKTIDTLIEESKEKVDISLRKFQHEWDQFSIIARFEGKDVRLSNAPIIVAAHLDSINGWSPLMGRAPGADDDGSGTVLILDIFRVLISKGFQPERPVEFHWYSAEEAGLLGSQDIAHSYKKRGVDVFAMLQNDQSGFVRSKDKEVIAVITDYVDRDLTGLVKLYVNAYTDIPIHETKCGYACSDHASWEKAGYRAAFASEGDFDDQCPYIHGDDDVAEYVDFEHMWQIAKLNLGFIVELGNFKN